MSFENQEFLYLLFLIPVIFAVSRNRKRRVAGVEFMSAHLPDAEREPFRKKLLTRIIFSRFLLLMFSLCVIICVSGPRWGTKIIFDNRRGLDLVLAFDISSSMNVTDCPSSNGGNSSRLQHSLAVARELCFRLDNIRYATATGKGRGVLMIPLTWDSESILNFLDSLDDSFLTGAGTNLESLLESAMNAFSDNMGRRRGIILFSDGEIHQGSLESAVDKARAQDIIISAIGVGSNEGSYVPAGNNPDGFLMAPDGTVVVSRRQEDALRFAANVTGGIYIDGSRIDAALALSDFYRSMAAETTGGFRRESAERWQLFLVVGLICLGVSVILGYRKPAGKKTEALKKTGKNFVAPEIFNICLLCVFLLLLPACSPVQGKLLVMEGNFLISNGRYNEAISSYLKALDYSDAFPYAEYGLAVSYSALDENEAALERYEAAEKSVGKPVAKPDVSHNELLYRIKYNKGVIHYERGEYATAAGLFKNALEIDGSRVDAKRNLELSLLAIERTHYNDSVSSAGTGAHGGGVPNSSRSAGIQQGTQTLFDYIRGKEQDQWKNESTGETNTVWPNY